MSAQGHWPTGGRMASDEEAFGATFLFSTRGVKQGEPSWVAQKKLAGKILKGVDF